MLKRNLKTDILLAIFLLTIGFFLNKKRVFLINYWLKPIFDIKNLTLVFFTLLLIIYFAYYKIKRGKGLFSIHLLLTIILYFPWALVQQLIVILLLYIPLINLFSSSIPAIVFSSMFFASFHLPKISFFFSTFLGEIVFLTYFYFTNNLFILVLCHSLIASFYYFWYLNDNVLKRRLDLCS